MKKKRKIYHYERLLKFIIIGAAVILFWRGIWGVADVLLFPNNYLLSSTTSIIIGLIVIIAVHASFRDLF